MLRRKGQWVKFDRLQIEALKRWRKKIAKKKEKEAGEKFKADPLALKLFE